MDKKQYFHQMAASDTCQGRFTVVVEVPTKEEITKITALTFYHDVKFGLKCGIALMNPKDKHYDKRIGRNIANSNITEQTFRLQRSQYFETETILTLISERDDCLIYTIKLESKIGRNKLYLVDVAINENLRK